MTTTTTAPSPSPSLAVWSTGDYRQIGRLLPYMSETMVEAVDLRAGERVLDIASGSGNAALAAARRCATVTATDIVSELLHQVTLRAAAELVDIETVPADAALLPFPDSSYDVITSAIGVMFVPDQAAGANEALRVLRPGGRLALASWCPDGFIGELFAVTARHAPAPAGGVPPFRWGTADGLAELFGSRVSWERQERVSLRLRYASPAAFVELFASTYGPTMKALGRIDEAARAALLGDLNDLFARSNIATDGSYAADWDYLLAVGAKA